MDFISRICNGIVPDCCCIGQPNDYAHFETFNLTLSFSQRLTNNLNFNISYLRSKFMDDNGIHGVLDYITPDSVSLAYGGDYYTNGLYIQDLVKYKKWQLLLSLRQEFYIYPKSNDLSVQGTLEEKQSEKAFMPRIGITYALTDNINVYATYNTGFEAQDSYSISAPGAGGPFDPLTSFLYEAGAKGEFFKKRLFGSVAVYQITQNNVLVSANDQSHPNLLIQRGQERARGVELEAGGYITSNFSVQLSYAYNNAIITKSTTGDPDKQVGLTKEGAPKNVSGSWIKYSFRSGALKGFGAGHSQVGKKETYDRNLQIPGYLIFNGAAYYQVDRFLISANINNITGKKYLTGGFNYYRTFPGVPKNCLVSVAYTF